VCDSAPDLNVDLELGAPRMTNPEATKSSATYRFGDFVLVPERASLLKAGQEIRLRPKVFDALRYLIENRGRLVPKEELIQTLWPEAFVTDDSLVQCMVELRRALNDRAQEILKTVPRRGYIFTAAVTTGTGPSASASADLPQVVRGDHRLPVARTPLVGRERELEAVQQLLRDPAVRLVTLTGAGGSGKTRLGLELCHELLGVFRRHVFFVALGSISDPAMVPAAIAESVGIREAGGRPFTALLKEYLRDCEPATVLLLLDNMEHILAATPLVVELIESSRSLKVLVTSRSPLRVYGEYELPVPPLTLPDARQMNSLPALEENPAIRLFAQRAQAVKPEFQLTAENAPIVAEICSRVDGLPLAIELAAARVKMLPLSGILTRLQSRLQLLTAGARDLPERQQTLRNTIDWSYCLLTEAEQKLLRRLSIFWGGCTLEGAEAVCNTKEDLGADILELMTSLVDKSLLQQQQRQLDPDEPRFRMLETIREYSLERLQHSGEESASKRAHAAYCLVLAEEGNPELSEPERAAWLTRCDIEHDDFRAALDFLFQAGDVDWGFRFCTALFRFWDMREHSAEGRARLERMIELAGAKYSRERAKACLFLGAFTNAQGDFPAAAHFSEMGRLLFEELNDPWGIALSWNSSAIMARDCGDYDTAQNNFEKSLTFWRTVGDRVSIARCLHNLGNISKIRGDHARARMALTEAMQIFEELGDDSGAAWALNQQGDVAREQGDLPGARALYERALFTFRSTGDRWGQARSLADLGIIACELGEHSAAFENFSESLDIFTRLEHRRGIARVLEGLACFAMAKGNARRALSVAAAASHLRQVVSNPLPPAEQSKLNQKLFPAWNQLGEVEGKQVWNEGYGMTMENAIRYALAE